MAAAPNIIIFRMVHIITSSNLRCAKTLAEQLHPLPHTEIRGSFMGCPGVTKNTPTLMTLIGLRRQTDGSCWAHSDAAILSPSTPRPSIRLRNPVYPRAAPSLPWPLDTGRPGSRQRCVRETGPRGGSAYSAFHRQARVACHALAFML